MSAVERVPVPVEGRAPGGSTNAYVVGTAGAVLVDPAAPHERLDAILADRGCSHIVLTHAHPDHCGGLAHYADRTGAAVWGRAGRLDRLRNRTGVDPAGGLRAGHLLAPDVGPPLRVLETPGHAPDHLAFVADDVGGTDGATCLVGDVAIADGSVAVAAPEGDMRAYLTSLRRLRQLDLATLRPGHGPPVDAPADRLAELIAHRIDRERRVREAVAAGAETPAAITDRAYDVDLTGLRGLAESTVVAHLEKLAVEKRVRWDGARARPVP